MEFPRRAGVLLAVSSLPGPFGIGSLGQEARQFIDTLAATGQSWWQILPVVPTAFGDSPYQSPSAFAGNPYLIDPRLVYETGYMDKAALTAAVYDGPAHRVDYAFVRRSRRGLFQQALPRFIANPPTDFAAFCEKSPWLEDYALFMAVKETHHGRPLWQWEEDIRHRRHAAVTRWRQRCREGILYHSMMQYFFYRQWQDLRAYAHSKGVRLMGDIPIYVAADSADVWANPHIFQLNNEGQPAEVAGCPPDAFSTDGQLWGNPVYDWRALRLGGYRFWIQRLQHSFSLTDALRIDHFRGFTSYYSIPAGADNARTGQWKPGPGMSLWNAVARRLGDLPIIAEDLGHMTPDVERLLADSGFPGMKVLQFAFDGNPDNPHLPYNHPAHSVVYTGTHDNDTLMGWVNSLPTAQQNAMRRYLRVSPVESLHHPLLAAALASPAAVCILPLQDILGLGSEARMNTPSTLGDNWLWRATPTQIEATQPAFRWLADNTALYGRRAKRSDIDD